MKIEDETILQIIFGAFINLGILILASFYTGGPIPGFIMMLISLLLSYIFSNWWCNR